MAFWKKALYYLIGVGMGSLIVIFLFGDRDIQCSYFPNDRVLNDLRKKKREIPEEVQIKMQLAGLDTADISQLLLSGKVDFEKSKTKEDSCNIYWVNAPTQEPAFSAEIMNCDSTTYILEVLIDGN